MIPSSPIPSLLALLLAGGNFGWICGTLLLELSTPVEHL
jgi:hypothetical protein